MDIAPVLISQYLASLAMLEQAIAKCPQSLWDVPGERNPFWQVAYHALFFTHLYLGDSEESFVPWTQHREGHEDFGVPESPQSYDKGGVMAYLAFCRQYVAERVPQLKLEETANFHNRRRTVLELQIYSIRHVMQHTGELMQRLSGLDEEIDWVGSVYA